MKILKQAVGVFTIFLMVLNISAESFAQEEMEGISLGDLLNLEITTAGKKVEKISEIPASVVIITREDIETYGYRTLTEVLENVPGLYNIDDWSLFGSNFGIRGFWNDLNNRNVIFLVNGVRQVNNYTSSNEILTSVNVPVEAVDRIEVVRGPMSVIYGSGAFYGAINIITNEADESTRVSLVSASAGTEKTYKLAARFSGQEGDIRYAFNASYYDSEGPDIPLNKLGENLEGTSDGELQEELRHFSLSGTFRDFYATLSYDGSSFVRPFLVPPDPDFNPKTLSEVTRVSFGYKKEVTSMVALDAKLDFSDYHLHSRYDFGLENDALQHENINSRATGIELNAFITPSPDLDITVGLNYHAAFDMFTEYDIPDLALSNVRMSLDEEDTITTRAFYTQAKYRMLDNLIWVAGIRLEQQLKFDASYQMNASTPGEEFSRNRRTFNEDEDVAVIPRFAAIYSLNDRNVFKLLYGEAINRPTLYQDESALIHPHIPELEPEEIRTVELNYSAVLSSKLNASFSLFRNEMDNLILRRININPDNTITLLWGNFGKMSTNGAEFQIQAKPLDRLQLDIAVTYQDTEDENNRDIDVAFSPKILGYVKASYRFSDNITLAVTGNYVDEMESQWSPFPSDENDPDSPPVGRIGDKADSYFNLGANVRIENLLWDGMYFSLKCSNLLDTDIYYPINSNQSWPTKGTMANGRAFMATLGWKF